MARLTQGRIWIATMVFSALAALSVWYGITHRGQAGLTTPPSPPPDRRAGEEAAANIDGGLALRYAEAVRENNCSTVIDMVWWVQERLRHVRMSGGAASIDEETERLCNQLTSRGVGANQLTSEGVDDQYIFRPGAEIAAVARDEGRTDLDKPVDYRIWLKVTYPQESSALRNDIGQSIRSLRVGVNISVDGYVLKAGVNGNTEVDWDSINYAWSSS